MLINGAWHTIVSWSLTAYFLFAEEVPVVALVTNRGRSAYNPVYIYIILMYTLPVMVIYKILNLNNCWACVRRKATSLSQELKDWPFQPWYKNAYSPYGSPYISNGTSKGKLSKYQNILSSVITSFILYSHHLNVCVIFSSLLGLRGLIDCN